LIPVKTRRTHRPALEIVEKKSSVNDIGMVDDDILNHGLKSIYQSESKMLITLKPKEIEIKKKLDVSLKKTSKRRENKSVEEEKVSKHKSVRGASSLVMKDKIRKEKKSY
jgi:hypothetical protein